MINNSTEYRLDEIGFGSLRIYQNPSDFCYGVDAVILSDFAKMMKGRRIIDLGCGNAIIPLILTHKIKNTHITGVEFNPDAYQLATENIRLNNLTDQIEIINSDIINLKLEDESYDTVVTNPPYVAAGRGLMNNCKDHKMSARHETTASLDDFIRISAGLLINKGEFFMVHRPSRTVEIINTLSRYKLEPKIIRYVSPRPGINPNIMLIKAIKNGGSEIEIREPLYVYNEDGSYSDELMLIYER